jgi:hypothetical protein
MIRKLIGAGILVLACTVLLPAAAYAQSAIAGIVKDTSGAILPGVTVEAASDVLIEKSRTVTTDGEGAYRIVDLRPGTYTVTFSLAGPNGRSTYLLVTPGTTWSTITCLDSSKCTVGQRIIPGLTQSNLLVNLNPAQTEYAPRLTQVDLSFSKVFQVGGVRVNPKLDVFNAFNSDDWTGVTSMQFGAATYKRPAVILQGRVIRIGADLKW